MSNGLSQDKSPSPATDTVINIQDLMILRFLKVIKRIWQRPLK